MFAPFDDKFLEMKILLNQKEVCLEEVSSITYLLSLQNIPDRGIAVALNNQVVRREQWDTTQLAEGDSVTVIVAAFGG